MRKQSLVFGILGGILFFAHGMINNSHAWPLVWPALAGLLAVWTSRGAARRSYGADLGQAAGAGLIAGAIFLVATAVTLSQMQLGGPISLAGLAFAAALGLLAAVIAGGLAHPVARRVGAD